MGTFVAYSDDPRDNEGNEFQPRNALNLMLKNWTNITCASQNGGYSYAIEITQERFPDAAFRERVCSQYDTNSDGWLQVSEMASVDGLDCENLEAVSLKGIEFFPRIVNLWAGFNQLTTLDLSGNPLVRNVQVYQNQLSGNGVNEFIASLPTLPVPSDMANAQGSICAIMNTDELTESNNFGMAQVANANAKGWAVREYYPLYNSWSLYDGSEFIIFEDANTKAYCVEHFDTNGDNQLSYAEAAAVRPSQLSFKTDAGGLVHFDEFQYFTGLTYLPDQCFYSINSLQTITLPNTLKSVSKEAFRFCSQLQRVTLQEGIKSIRNDAFHGCTQLTTIQLPASLDSIGQYAFNICRDLASVEYAGNSIKTVGTYAFQNCNALTSFPFDRVERIEAKAFRATGLTKVTTNAYHIGRGAFEVNYPITITLLRNYFNTISNQPYDNQEGLHLPITSDTPVQGTQVRVDRNIFHDAYNATTTAREYLQPYIKLNHYQPYQQFDDQGSDAVTFSCELPVQLPQGSRIYIVTGLNYNENNGEGKALTRAMPGNVVPANTGVIVKLPGRDIEQEQYWYLTVAPDATATGNYSSNLLEAAVGQMGSYGDTEGYMLFEWNAQFYNGEYYYSFMTNMDAMWADGCTAFLRLPLSQTPSGETGGANYALDLMMLGDVNGDGKADVTDVNSVINIMLGKTSASNYAGNADINADNSINVSDVNKVINIMLGKE